MGLFSKIFKGIKKVVKGVAKGIKKVVKGVAKVVKKVAKSKIFKAVLAAAAIYVTGGAALSSFGVTTGKLGAWAAKAGSGVFSSGVAGAIATPFKVLGSALGTGARAVTDFTGITEPNLLDASKSFPIGDPANYDPNIATGKTPVVRFDGTTVQADTVVTDAATDAATDAVVDNVTKGSGWSDFGKSVGTSVATNVATGYVMSKLTEEDPTGQMSGLALEGKGQLDPFAVYYGDGKPLSIADAYGQLLYGTGDPMYNQGNTTNLYTQDIAPVAA